jgi:hypothetical protein
MAMEYVCFAVDIGSNMGPRMCDNLRSLDKTASHLDLALHTLLSLYNRKVSGPAAPLLPPPPAARAAAIGVSARLRRELIAAPGVAAADRESQASSGHRNVRLRGCVFACRTSPRETARPPARADRVPSTGGTRRD